MKTTLAVLLLLVALGSSRADPRVAFDAPAGSVAAYDFIEVTLNVAGSQAANPFTEVTVTGAFGPDGGEPVAVDGFCDAPDGSVHRIRFMPTRPGPHHYEISYREGAFEAKHSGTFTATDARRRGLLRVDPGFPSHFQWEGTKERYFWNGSTAYWLAGWDDATIARILDRLDFRRITRVRAALAGRVADGQAWFEDVRPSDTFSFRLEPWMARNPASLEAPDFDVTRFNLAYWRKWERLLQDARRRDMIVSVVFFVDGVRPGVDPFGPAGMGGPDEQRYYRYAIARLGAFSNVMWDLANEYRLFRDDTWAGKMGAFVKQCDPYDHLTSVHGHADFRFRASPWADFAVYQSWDEHGGHEFMLQNRLAQAQTGRVIPQVNEEYGYEDHYPRGRGEDRTAPARSALTRVRLAWEIAFAGGYQTTGERAGTTGGWINGHGDDTTGMLELYGHMYDFFTGITWWELEPDHELVVSLRPHPDAKGKDAAPPRARAFAARNPEGDLAAVYIVGGGIVSLNDERLKDQLKPLWFSPRDGGMRNARALRSRVYRTPDTDDWVLLFRTPCNCSFRDFDNEYER